MRQKEAERTCYTLYLAVHAAHAEAPHVWTDSYWTRILTSFMTSQPFSWRVVGITEAALRKFHEQDYQYVTGQKLQRAHLRQRIDTVRELLGRRQPMSQSEFIEYWIENDTTVLCGERENTANVPSYIEIENPDGSLFTCQQVTWQHKEKECDLLRTLYERFIAKQHSRRAPVKEARGLKR